MSGARRRKVLDAEALLVDVTAAEVIEPWGGGKWHMEVFQSRNQEPDEWNGEI